MSLPSFLVSICITLIIRQDKQPILRSLYHHAQLTWAKRLRYLDRSLVGS
jgi:hypothetical protein